MSFSSYKEKQIKNINFFGLSPKTSNLKQFSSLKIMQSTYPPQLNIIENLFISFTSQHVKKGLKKFIEEEIKKKLS